MHQHVITPKGEESGGVVDDDARVGAPDVDGGVFDVADVAPLDGPQQVGRGVSPRGTPRW